MSNHHHDNNGRSASLPWKSVNVTLPEPTQDSSNHYDNHHPHTNNNVKDELEAVPGEHVAMFYGLEVLQGHEYTVNKNGELLLRCAAVVTTTEGGDGGIGGGHADQQQQQQQESNKRGVQKKERGNKKRKASSSTGNDMTSFSDTTATTTTPDDDEQLEATTELSIGDSHERRESKRKKKKKKKQPKQQPPKQESTNECPDDEQQQQQQQADKDVVVEVVDDVDVERMQTSWMIATGGVTLDPRICSSLVQQDFWMPTPIQSATLPAALMGRRNIVGAAPTGSGKTLAYLLPIVQYLLLLQPEKEENNAAPPVVLSHSHLLALILTPTRELALQVSRECDKLIPNKKQCGTIVGGLALQKQERILTKNKPPILVATPGRLWELVRFIQ
jgi:ATP-dependent RNA helicase DDX24/MAK5